MAQQNIKRQNPNSDRPNKTNNDITRKKKRTKRNKRKKALSFFVLLIFAATVICIFINNKGSLDYQAKKNLSDVVNDNVKISKFYTYGNHFNFGGTLKISSSDNLKDVDLIFRNTNGDETNYKINYEVYDKKIVFYTSEIINEGIYLDKIPEGSYFLLLKLTYDNNKSKYYSMLNDSKHKNIEYYTVTKNDKNNKIDIAFDSYEKNNKNCSYFNITVKSCNLPDDVYDVVIDAGHGGNDSGASYGKYYEADITLKYAKDFKKSLENLGLKVKLTRDGTESKDKAMAFTMYDNDGIVNVACASKAKYNFSIHLNSNESSVKQGGVQIYCNSNLNTGFAQSMAENIVEETGINYSNMVTYKASKGVYVRSFTKQDISESKSTANSKGYKPYSITTDTNYYFIIRELGGIATNAYIDGRNTEYGKNNYHNSNYGIESYLMELGFLSESKDRNIILNDRDEYVKAITRSIADELGINN